MALQAFGKEITITNRLTMKKLLFTLLCLPMIVFGQEWTFGGVDEDFGTSVQQTIEGGYIITGQTRSFGNGSWDVYLIKTDQNGIEQWNKTFGGINDDEGKSVQQTADGGYIIVGVTESFGLGNGDIYLIKTDGNGDSLWTKTFGGLNADWGNSVQQTVDEGYVIAGVTESFGAGGRDVYLIKTDGNGDSLWTKAFGGSDEDEGNSVQQTTDSGYIIIGNTRLFTNGDNDIYLIKTDENGVEQWNQTFGGSDEDEGNCVQETNDGGYIITGGTRSFGIDTDVYLIKTDGNGIEQWDKTFGGAYNDIGTSVQQTTDGGYIVCGVNNLALEIAQLVYLIKTDVNGVEQWSQTFGGLSPFSAGNSVQQTTDGGYIVCGWIIVFEFSPSEVYLIKTDGNGNITSTFNIPIKPNRKLEKTVDMLGRDIKPQTNTLLIEIYDDGTVEKRIVIK